MSLAGLRCEAIHVVEAPRAILADRPMGDEEGAAALRDWRKWTADGRATLHRGVLCISDQHEPTDAEWAALYARPGGMPH
ncbi:hypothetical protein MPEAHAMD_7201 [Methylobacterium frigidaeris]|uniref:Uncharacterized protein n=1 Tax=Methylobacterium frigidaeris TaxID=2038277 RepID=A0AA37HJ19_9HYPH|nr:hypothetical protein MPEAHAMD_7201 [Methylobacterium frigidaeris]